MGDNIGVVDDYTLIPPELDYPHVPADYDSDQLTVDMTTELGDNEAILLPDMDVASSRYWSLREMETPRAMEPYHMGGGQYRQDYAWRYSHYFNPKGDKRFAAAEDAVHIKNLDVLLG
jgi:hypothetical protein